MGYIKMTRLPPDSWNKMSGEKALVLKPHFPGQSSICLLPISLLHTFQALSR